MPTTIPAIPGITTGSQSQSGQPSSILGKDDFLKLLTMQLKNQDPMNPMDGTQFASQLAQFSSVEQLSNINSTLEQSIDANYLLSQSINNALAATFVGKDIRANGNTFHFETTPVKLGYTLPSAADSVTVKVYDASGSLVKTLTNTGKSAGDNSFEWDGTNDGGQTLDPGTYKFVVEAKDSSGSTIATSTFFSGSVSGVRFKADGTVFVVDGTEVRLSDILEIMEG